MRCFECGAENLPDSFFCRSCGRRLRPDAPDAPDAPNAPDAPEETETEETANDAERVFEAPSGGADYDDNAADAEETANNANADEAAADGTTADGTEDIAEDDGGGNAPDTESADAAEPEYTAPGETLNDGSYRLNYENYKICPRCGEKLPPDSNFCTSCAYRLEDAAPKKKRVRAPIIAAAALLAAALLTAFALLCPKAYDLEGTWVSSDSGSGLFGMLGGSYMVIDDDSLEYYYNAFFSSEYEYSYNAFTRTLKLYGGGSKTQTLHLKWVDSDTFVIIENGESFNRIADGGDGDDDDEKYYSI